MESIPKFLASVITIIIGVLLCVSLVVSAVVVNSARVYHASVIDHIEASNFEPTTISKCVEAARENGYRLKVESSSTPESEPYSFYKVTMEYDLKAPMFSKHTGTLVGYALSGAHMDIIVPGSEPGLYESGSGYAVLLKSWKSLEEEGIINTSGGVVSVFGSNAAVLDGDLLLPSDGSVTEIADGGFYQCANLTGIKISDDVVLIGQNAFADCSALEMVEIGQNVEMINTSAFAGCTNISAVNYIGEIDGWCDITFVDAQANPVYSAGTGADLYFQGQMVEAVVIPADTSSIYNKFIGCKSIKSVLIPDSSNVSVIPNYAFYKCDNLLTVNIGSSVQSIEDYAFAECLRLQNVTCSGIVGFISTTAFENCTSLQNIFKP